MVECKKEGCVNLEAQRVVDHSVLMWNLALAGGWMHAGQDRVLLRVGLTDT